MVDFGLNYDALVNAREEAKRGNEDSPSIGDFIKTISSKFSQLGSEIKNNTREMVNKENKKIENKLTESEKRTTEVKNEILSELSDLNSKFKGINEKTVSILNKITEYFKEDKSEFMANKNSGVINSSLKGINNLTKMVTGIQKESFKDVKNHISNSLNKVHSSIITNQKSSNMSSIDIIKNNIGSIKETLLKKNIGIEKKIIGNSKHISKISGPIKTIKSGLMGFVNWITSPFKKMLGFVTKIWDFVKFARIVLPMMAFMLSPPGLILMGGILIAALIYSPKFREFMLGIVDWAFEKISDVIDKFLPEPIANVLNFLLETGYDAIKGLIVFLGELSDNWDDPLWWLEKLQGLGNWIIDKVKDYGKVLMDNIIKPISNLLGEVLPKPVVDVLAFFGRKFNEGLEGLFTFLFELKNNWDSPTWWFEKFNGMGKWMLESFLEYGDLLLKLVTYVWDAMPQGIKDFFNWVGEKFMIAWNWYNDNFIKPIGDAIGSVVAFFSKPISLIVDAISSWWAGKEAAENVSDVKNVFTTALDQKSGTASAMDLQEAVETSQIASAHLAMQGIDHTKIASMSGSELREVRGALNQLKGESLTMKKLYDVVIKLNSERGEKGLAEYLASNKDAFTTLHGAMMSAKDQLYSSLWGNMGDVTGFDDWSDYSSGSNAFESEKTEISGEMADISQLILKRSDLATLQYGGIVTQPTKTLIGEAGDHEAVIPLNDQGVQFMKDTILSALKEIKVENPREVEATEKDNSIENKLDGLTSTISDLVKSINSSMSNSKSRVEAVGEPPQDPLNEFTKMIASGVLSNRRGGI